MSENLSSGFVNNRGANLPAPMQSDQRLVIRLLESIISKLAISEICELAISKISL